MKKISFILTAACALWAFSSCCADKEPVYQRPAEGSYVLNTPVMQNQYIDLADCTNIDLVSSQPDYGYSAVANYSAQMSLTPDFEEYISLRSNEGTLAKMTIPALKITEGFCTLMGIVDAENPEEAWDALYPNGAPYTTFYFRTVCDLTGVAGSQMVSNVVSYNYLKPYFAVPIPGKIYLAGGPAGWASAGNVLFPLTERVVDSMVYWGNYEFDPGENYFRFYTTLGDWGGDGALPSVGPLPNDNTNVEVVFYDGSFAGNAVPGKGSWRTSPDFSGGMLYMKVDLSNPAGYTVVFSLTEIPDGEE